MTVNRFVCGCCDGEPQKDCHVCNLESFDYPAKQYAPEEIITVPDQGICSWYSEQPKFRTDYWDPTNDPDAVIETDGSGSLILKTSGNGYAGHAASGIGNSSQPRQLSDGYGHWEAKLNMERWEWDGGDSSAEYPAGYSHGGTGVWLRTIGLFNQGGFWDYEFLGGSLFVTTGQRFSQFTGSVKYERWVTVGAVTGGFSPNYKFGIISPWLEAEEPSEFPFYYGGAQSWGWVTEYEGEITVQFCMRPDGYVWRIPEWKWSYFWGEEGAHKRYSDFFVDRVRGLWVSQPRYVPGGGYGSQPPQDTHKAEVQYYLVEKQNDHPDALPTCYECQTPDQDPPNLDCFICSQSETLVCSFNLIGAAGRTWDTQGEWWGPTGNTNQSGLIIDDDLTFGVTPRRWSFYFKWNGNDTTDPAEVNHWRVILGYIDESNYVYIDFYFHNGVGRVTPGYRFGGGDQWPLDVPVNGAWVFDYLNPLDGEKVFIDCYRTDLGMIVVRIPEFSVDMRFATPTGPFDFFSGANRFGWLRLEGTGDKLQFSRARLETHWVEDLLPDTDGCKMVPEGGRCADLQTGNPLSCCRALVPGQLQFIDVYLSGFCQEFTADPDKRYRLFWKGNPETGEDLCTWEASFTDTIGGNAMTLSVQMFSSTNPSSNTEAVTESQFRIDAGGFTEWASTHVEAIDPSPSAGMSIGPHAPRLYFNGSTWQMQANNLCAAETLFVARMEIPEA